MTAVRMPILHIVKSMDATKLGRETAASTRLYNVGGLADVLQAALTSIRLPKGRLEPHIGIDLKISKRI